MSSAVGALLMLSTLHALTPQDVRARLITGPEADSNARRQISGQVPQPDALWRSQLALTVGHQEGRHRVTMDGQAGAKLFLQQRTEDLLVAEGRLRLDSRWRPRLGSFVELAGRDRRQRSGLRTYNTLTADAGVSVGPFGPLTLMGGGGPRLFVFWPVTATRTKDGTVTAIPVLEPDWNTLEARAPLDSTLRFSNVGAGVYGTALLRVSPVEVVSASLGVDARYFPLGLRASSVVDGARVFDARARPDNARDAGGQLVLPPRRADSSGFVEVAVESVRALYLRASFRTTGNLSTSRGEQYLKGRMGLTAGALLPGGVRALGELQVQATRWPEGLGLSERLALQEGDESQTSVGGQLSVPLAAGLWLEGRTAAYTAEFSSARTPFLRLVGFLGMGYRW